MSNNIRRTALVLVLALLATGAVKALPREGRVTPALPEPAGLFAPLWSWIAELFAPVGPAGENRPRAAWGEAGAEMDPNGRQLDEGPGMDPNGQDAGPGMDPNGAPQGFGVGTSDGGGMMDPNG